MFFICSQLLINKTYVSGFSFFLYRPSQDPQRISMDKMCEQIQRRWMNRMLGCYSKTGKELLGFRVIVESTLVRIHVTCSAFLASQLGQAGKFQPRPVTYGSTGQMATQNVRLWIFEYFENIKKNSISENYIYIGRYMTNLYVFI